MTNIDEVCSTIMSEQSEEKIYGIFTTSELTNLKNEFLTNLNTHQTVRKLLKPIFQKNGVRCFDELSMSEDEECVEAMELVQTMFYNLQMNVLVEKKEETTGEIAHLKGDPIRDENGNPKIDPTNQTRVLTYKKTEYKTRIVDTPIYNPTREFGMLDKLLSSVVIPPNFKELRSKLLDPSKISFERGCEIIRELTKYYIFEDPDKFVDRFSLLICNAKSKGLGIHPKYPVLFSLVGDYNKGKGWFSTMIRKTYDNVFKTRSQKSSFKRLLKKNDFNGVMMTRGFIALDEKNGADSAECEQLKTLITEPDVDISMKYKEDRTVQNLVTFLSTTNERIRGIMGLQKDRRIVEFVLKDKTMEIPEDLMTNLLTELWEVMPCVHPYSDKIIGELLNESKIIVDATMEQIVSDLFLKHKTAPLPRLEFDFCRKGLFLKVPAVKNAIKDLKYGRHEAIWDWMESNQLMKSYENGTWRFNKNNLEKFLETNIPEEFLPLIPNGDTNANELLDEEG